MHLTEFLTGRFRQALSSAALADWTESPDDFASMVRPTSDPTHGDYQSNAAMPLAKTIDGKNPREVAAAMVEALSIDDICDAAEIAGPGFINLRFQDQFLISSCQAMLGDERLSVSQTSQDKPIIIDFSGPNVAKPMHVGHIRSTVIGDSLTRTLRFMGYPVVTDNHLGDWGTQFGIIIYGYKNFGDPAKVDANPVPELATLYRLTQALIEYHNAGKKLTTMDDAIEAAKQTVVEQSSIADSAEGKEAKKARKALASGKRRVESLIAEKESLSEKRAAVEKRSRDGETGRRSCRGGDGRSRRNGQVALR